MSTSYRYYIPFKELFKYITHYSYQKLTIKVFSLNLLFEERTEKISNAHQSHKDLKTRNRSAHKGYQLISSVSTDIIMVIFHKIATNQIELCVDGNRICFGDPSGKWPRAGRQSRRNSRAALAERIYCYSALSPPHFTLSDVPTAVEWDCFLHLVPGASFKSLADPEGITTSRFC